MNKMISRAVCTLAVALLFSGCGPNLEVEVRYEYNALFGFAFLRLSNNESTAITIQRVSINGDIPFADDEGFELGAGDTIEVPYNVNRFPMPEEITVETNRGTLTQRIEMDPSVPWPFRSPSNPVPPRGQAAAPEKVEAKEIIKTVATPTPAPAHLEAVVAAEELPAEPPKKSKYPVFLVNYILPGDNRFGEMEFIFNKFFPQQGDRINFGGISKSNGREEQFTGYLEPSSNGISINARLPISGTFELLGMVVGGTEISEGVILKINRQQKDSVGQWTARLVDGPQFMFGSRGGETQQGQLTQQSQAPQQGQQQTQRGAVLPYAFVPLSPEMKEFVIVDSKTGAITDGRQYTMPEPQTPGDSLSAEGFTGYVWPYNKFSPSGIEVPADHPVRRTLVEWANKELPDDLKLSGLFRQFENFVVFIGHAETADGQVARAPDGEQKFIAKLWMQQKEGNPDVFGWHLVEMDYKPENLDWLSWNDKYSIPIEGIFYDYPYIQAGNR